MEHLDRWRWSGHSVIMGWRSRPWQAREEILTYFGTRGDAAREKYRTFISEGIALAKRKGLASEVPGKNSDVPDRNGPRDPRILGTDSFVAEVLSKVEHLEQEGLILKRKQVDSNKLMDFIAEKLGLTGEEIIGGSRRRNISKARSAFCYVCLTELGMTGKRLSDALQVSPAAVHLACRRGEVFLAGNEELRRSILVYLNNLSPSP